ncbi:LarC family nickel insertion protein [Acidisoma sp.]|uniref:LarC family nickel insertion protein n=1 Tax=Acidisoma sp. TaxID=1872115 RepID=UPI003AFFCBEF
MPPGHRHFHLDPLGGAAGDMFVACLLDAYPTLRAGALAAARAAADAECELAAHRDHVLTGSRFRVSEDHHHPHEPHGHAHDPGHGHGHHHDHGHSDHGHGHGHGHGHEHGHLSWAGIRANLEGSSLTPGVREHAVGIFSILAQAEARVHGVPIGDVTFHEVGAKDSIADIVAAAWLIDALSPATWSVGPLPLGGGSVRTAHGVMPVPAPATTLLMEGFATLDDGIGGERVTPTGAAILRYLKPVARPREPGVLWRTGIGFGTRALPGTSNVLRLLAFAPQEEASVAIPHRELAVITFEVDDQTPEDMAIALERLRALPGVHDVLQMAAWGKKGRMATHLQLLAQPEALEDAVEACFRETTTIGLRTHLVQARALTRRMHSVLVDGQPLRVKSVARPGGRSGKTEADDLVSAESQAARMALRVRAQRMVEEDDA